MWDLSLLDDASVVSMPGMSVAALKTNGYAQQDSEACWFCLGNVQNSLSNVIAST